MKILPQHILLFDGVCNLCSSSVQFVLKYDKTENIHFASLQSDLGQKILWENNMDGATFNSLVLVDNGRIYTRSTGALRTAMLMGGIWSILGIFLIVPPFIRDGVYSWISKNRYKWFGKKEECWIPQEKWRSRFLDDLSVPSQAK